MPVGGQKNVHSLGVASARYYTAVIASPAGAKQSMQRQGRRKGWLLALDRQAAGQQHTDGGQQQHHTDQAEGIVEGHDPRLLLHLLHQ